MKLIFATSKVIFETRKGNEIRVFRKQSLVSILSDDYPGQ